MIKTIKFVLLLILPVFFMSSISWAKPEPPKEFNEIWNILSELEEKYEEEEWDEALKEKKEISEKFEKIADTLKQNSKPEKITELSSTLKALDKAISSKDREETEEEYINLQKLLFVIMDDYNYAVHPAFITMEKYITVDAMEAAEKGEYKEVESEMKEVLQFSTNITFLYLRKRISLDKINAFNSRIKSVMNVCKSQKKEDVINELKKLKEDFNSLRVK